MIATQSCNNMHWMLTCNVTPERICPYTPSALRAALNTQSITDLNQAYAHGLESESGPCIQPSNRHQYTSKKTLYNKVRC